MDNSKTVEEKKSNTVAKDKDAKPETEETGENLTKNIHIFLKGMFLK